MGFFRKNRVPKITTVIGRKTELRGDVSFEGGLHVDGSIKGDVIGTPDLPCALILSESGRVEGDVRVANVILNGTVIGDVYATERAELAPQARVNGTLYYRMLETAMGAEVNGQLVHMDESETQRMLSYDGSPDDDHGGGAGSPPKSDVPKREEVSAERTVDLGGQAETRLT